MKKIIACLMAFVIAISGVTFTNIARAEETNETNKSLEGKKILFVGDSITYADDHNYANGWPGRIASQFGAETTNAGVSGASISTIRTANRVITQLENNRYNKYDYVILHGGVNDAWDKATVGTKSDSFQNTSFDTSTFAGGLEELICYAVEHFEGAKIGYIINYSRPTCSSEELQDMSEYFNVAKEVCDKWGISYLDLYSGKTEVDGEEKAYSADLLQTSTDTYFTQEGDIHLNAAGYDVISPYIGEWIQGIEDKGYYGNPLEGKSAIFLGDSITEDSSNGRRGWAGRIADSNGMSYVNAGSSGATVSTDNEENRIIDKFDVYKDNKYDYVIMHGGVNDAMREVPIGSVSNSMNINDFDTSTFAGALEELFCYVQQYQNTARLGYIVNYATPNSEWGGHTKDMSQYFNMAKQICEKWNVSYIDLYAGTVNEDGQEKSYSYDILEVDKGTYFKTDGISTQIGEIHLSADGYDRISPYIAEWMKCIKQHIAVTEQKYGWKMLNNLSGDTLALMDASNHGKILQVTKGDAEASDWVALAAPQIDVTGGVTYQLTFDKKLDDGASIAVSYCEFGSEGQLNSYDVDMVAGEADSNGWITESGQFTVTDDVEKIEIRIYCRGEAGATLWFDNFAVNPVAIAQPSAHLDQEAWSYQSGAYGGIALSAGDGADTITVVEEGNADVGSLHFVKKSDDVYNGNSLHVTNHVSTEAGKVYVFEMYYKGDVEGGGNATQNKALIDLGSPTVFATWNEASLGEEFVRDKGDFQDAICLQNDAEDWTKVTAEFTAVGADAMIKIKAPSICWNNADFYIDNVKVYLKDDATQTNLLENGDFYIDNSKKSYLGDVWSYTSGNYGGSQMSAGNGADTITVAEEGNADVGSLHFVKKSDDVANNNKLYVTNHVSTETDKVYVFEMYYKGDVEGGNNATGNKALIDLSNPTHCATWNEDSLGAEVVRDKSDYQDSICLQNNAEEWTKVAAEFTAVGTYAMIKIAAPSTCWNNADFYIDNVKVYLKDDATQTNLLENGDFWCDNLIVDTETNLLSNGDFDSLPIAELRGTSLSLGGNIGVNFYMELFNVPDTAYIKFALPNGTTESVAIPAAASENGYCFTAEVSAKEMTADIQAQMFLEEGTAISDVYTYSVEAYADDILNGEYTEATKDLVKAMLRYGAYAQQYFKSPFSGNTLSQAVLDAYMNEEAWSYGVGAYGGIALSAGNGADTITVAEEGNADVGSLHFVKKSDDVYNGNSLHVTNHVSTEVGKVYVFEMYYKGDVEGGGNATQNKALIDLGSPTVFATWNEASLGEEFVRDKGDYQDAICLQNNAEEWTKVTAEFTAVGADAMIKIKAPSICWNDADFYIDNVKVYLKDDATQTNLLENGDFYTVNMPDEVTIEEAYKASVTKADSVAQLISSQLVLTSETTMKMKFKLHQDVSDLTIKVDDSDANYEINGDICTVIIDNLAAHDLDQMMVVTISDGTDTLTVTNCALTYAYNVLKYDGSPEELKNVVKALYLYNQAANTYVQANQ